MIHQGKLIKRASARGVGWDEQPDGLARCGLDTPRDIRTGCRSVRSEPTHDDGFRIPARPRGLDKNRLRSIGCYEPEHSWRLDELPNYADQARAPAVVLRNNVQARDLEAVRQPGQDGRFKVPLDAAIATRPTRDWDGRGGIANYRTRGVANAV